MLEYAEEWKRLVRRGITSYLGSLKMLKDARAYHGSRSIDTFNDDGGTPSKHPLKCWIPLLWGTF